MQDIQDFLRQVVDLEGVNKQEPFDPENPKYEGILRVRDGGSFHFYGYSHGEVVGSVLDRGGNYTSYLSIQSIDDESLPFLGPLESREKAIRRLERMVALAQKWGVWIPTKAMIDDFCKQTGTYFNY